MGSIADDTLLDVFVRGQYRDALARTEREIAPMRE